MANHAIVDAGDSLVVYLTESRKIFRVPSVAQAELDALCNDPAGASCTGSALRPIASALLNPTAAPDGYVTPPNALRKLSLNVTNSCNMACRYCYTNEGEYGSPLGLMRPEVASRSVEMFLGRFERLGAVQFFGGEPLMNVAVIEQVCADLTARHEAGALAEMPMLGLVTNGTIVNSRVERLLATYDIHVTVSFDGPPSVNDLVRPLKSDARPASRQILDNAKRLADAAGRPVGIETTWSKAQQDAGLEVPEVVAYLREAFETRDVHVAPVTLPDDHPLRPCGLDEFPRSVPAFTDQVLAGDPSTFGKYRGALSAFTSGASFDIFCDAGIGTLSVSSSGRVYPCFMFVDQEEFDMGTVMDDDLFESPRFREVTARFAAASKRDSEQCGGCAFRSVCAGCLGANFIETGDPFTVSPMTCQMNYDFHKAMLVAAHRVGSHG